MSPTRIKSEIKRVEGYLKEVITFLDESGKPIGHLMNPIMVEIKPRDCAQIFVGSFIMAAPLCFTEEIWNLSVQLHLKNIYMIAATSLFGVVMFVYFNFYRFRLKGHVIEFFKRIVAIYIISTSSVALILFLIDKLPINEDPVLAMKRVVLIGLPSIFMGTIADSLK